MEQLPDEVVTDILTFLPIKQRVSLRTVSKLFKQLLDDDNVWKHELETDFAEEYDQLEEEKEIVDWNPNWQTFRGVYKILYLAKCSKRRGVPFARCSQCEEKTLCERSKDLLLYRDEWKQLHPVSHHTKSMKLYEKREIENYIYENVTDTEMEEREREKTGNMKKTMIQHHNKIIDFKQAMKTELLNAGIPKEHVADSLKRIHKYTRSSKQVQDIIKNEKTGLTWFTDFEKEVGRWPSFIQQSYLLELSKARRMVVRRRLQWEEYSLLEKKQFLKQFVDIVKTEKLIECKPVSAGELSWAQQTIDSAESEQQKQEYLIRALKLNRKLKRYGFQPPIRSKEACECIKQDGDLYEIMRDLQSPDRSVNAISWLRIFERAWDVILAECHDEDIFLKLEGVYHSEEMWKDLSFDNPLYKLMKSIVDDAIQIFYGNERLRAVLQAAKYEMFIFYESDRKVRIPSIVRAKRGHEEDDSREEDSIVQRVHKRRRVAGRFSK